MYTKSELAEIIARALDQGEDVAVAYEQGEQVRVIVRGESGLEEDEQVLMVTFEVVES
jgi:hypothetical protein